MNENPGDEEDLTSERGPQRTCIVTREKRSPAEMIRFVVSPEGAVVPDIRARLPGRGVWVTTSQAQVALAVKRQGFARGFKAKVTVDAGLPAQVDTLLEAAALQSLAMANKAGAVVTGFAKVESALSEGPVLALLNARDASADGLRKLAQAVRRSGTNPPVINIFDSLQLDLALGRTNVIHAAVKEKAAGAAFLARAQRLGEYRGVSPAKPAETTVLPLVLPPED